MFRRFMTACWVLFALAAILAIGSGVAYKIAENQLLSLRTETMVDDRMESGHEIESGLRHIANGYDETIEYRKAHENIPIGASEAEAMLIRLQAPHDYSNLSDEQLQAKSRSTHENALLANTQNARKRIAENAFFFASILATLILLWNLIWHTGHWIWMGRRVGKG